jgi:colanic acid biosynthesis glycosyl transferase WcaI
MKILITTKRFPPEIPATAVLGEELAQELGRYGHQVTVAAGYPQHPYGRLFPGYRKQWLSVEEVEGFRLVRGWHFIHPAAATPMRVMVMVSQCFSYFLSALYSDNPEVVISFDGYPLVGPLVSILIARWYGAKVVNVIYDIYPDIAIELGKLKNPLLIKISQKVEQLVYHWSDQIIVLSEGFRRTLIEEKGVLPEKVTVIPVWLDARNIVPLDRDNPWRREMEIPLEKFVILYAGTIGLISGAEIITAVAQSLASYAEIQFLMVGDGYAKEQVQTRARDLGLNNILFLPFQPRERLSEMQATADISLVTLAPGRGRTSVPSKVLGYMAAARPVIAAVDLDCDTAKIVNQARCGIVVPPADPESLAQAILYYFKHPSERISSGNKGLTYFLEHFDKKVIIKQYLNLIETLIRR